MLPGICAHDVNRWRANEVQSPGIRGSILGGGEHLLALVLRKAAGNQPGEVAINTPLAHPAAAQAGATRSASGSTVRHFAARCASGPDRGAERVSAFESEDCTWPRGVARFSLRAEQSAPPIAFVAPKELQSVHESTPPRAARVRSALAGSTPTPERRRRWKSTRRGWKLTRSSHCASKRNSASCARRACSRHRAER